MRKLPTLKSAMAWLLVLGVFAAMPTRWVSTWLDVSTRKRLTGYEDATRAESGQSLELCLSNLRSEKSSHNLAHGDGDAENAECHTVDGLIRTGVHDVDLSGPDDGKSILLIVSMPYRRL